MSTCCPDLEKSNNILRKELEYLPKKVWIFLEKSLNILRKKILGYLKKKVGMFLEVKYQYYEGKGKEKP